MATTSGGAGLCDIQWQSSLNGITWNNIAGAIGNSYTANNLSTSMYYRATYTCSGNGCTPAVTSNTQFVNIVNLQLLLAANAPSICLGGSDSVTIAGGNVGTTYTWQVSTNNGATWTNIAGYVGTSATLYSASPSITSMYKVIANDPVCGIQNPSPQTVSIAVNANPNITVSGTSSICFGSNVTLSASTTGGTGNCNLQWQNSLDGINWSNIVGAIGNGYTSPNLIVTTYYRAIYTCSGNGCSPAAISNSFMVNVGPSLVANAGPDIAYCIGGSATLGTPATAGNTYLWTPNTNLTGANTAMPVVGSSINRTYVLTVTQTSTGCIGRDTVNVVVNALPNATISGPTTFCAGGNTFLSANTGANLSYQWYIGNNSIVGATNSNYTPIATGNHKVVVTDANGCSKTSGWYGVTVNPAPIANAGVDKSLCIGSSTTIGVSGSPSYTYSWSPTNNLSSAIIANPSTNTPINRTYFLLVTNPATGCVKRDTVNITVNPVPSIPTVSVNGSNPFCLGSGTFLSTPQGMAAYQWYAGNNAIIGATSSNYTPIATGNHKVVVSNVYGCTRTSAWQSVTVNVLPTAIAGVDKTICEGSPTQIGTTNNAAYSYSWSPAIGLSSTTISNPLASPLTNTQYIVMVTVNATQCSKTDTVNIFTNPLPTTPTLSLTTPLLPGVDSLIYCEGTNVMLTGTAAGFNSVYWYKSGIYYGFYATSMVSNLSLSPSGDVFIVKSKSLQGCYSLPSNPVFIQKTPAPLPSIYPSGTNNLILLCSNGTNIGTGTLTVATPGGAPVVNSFDWIQIIGGVPNNIGTGTSLPVSVTGTASLYFQVIANYNNGCSRASVIKAVKRSTLCREENPNDSIVVVEEVTEDISTEYMDAYPNPTEDILNVHVQNMEASEAILKIRNVLGQDIIMQPIILENGSAEISFDMRNFAKGMYFLTYVSGKKQIVKKIDKQ